MMLQELPDLWQTITDLEAAVYLLREAIVPDEESADAVGHVAAAERRLADWRRGLLAEAAASEGKEYALVEHREAHRTYNTGRLLGDFADRHGDQNLSDTLRWLIAERAVELKWRYTETASLAERHGVPFYGLPGVLEEDDLDGPPFRVVWKSRLGVEGRM